MADRWDKFAKRMEKFGDDMSKWAEQFAKDASEGWDDEDDGVTVNSIGRNNTVITGNGTSVKQTSVFGSSSSTIVQGGKKIVIKTKNGKTVIKVNGKEYVPKGIEK